jgi:hypothetical protein
MWLVALPAKTPPFESLEDSIATAINRRPDILRQRLAVYVAQQQTIQAADKMRPHLDFNAFWRINGLGEDVGSSIDSVADDQYTDWHIGLGFQVPLGRRQARGNLRAAQFTVEKQQALLDQAAHQSAYEVADAYRRAIWLSQQQSVMDSRVGALTQWRVGAKAQFESPPSGMSTTNALQLYLQNLRDVIDATVQSNAIMANFNDALVRLEEVKGTLLESEMVMVDGDGTDLLPPCLPTPKLQTPDSILPAPAPVQPAPPTTPPAPKQAPAAEPKPEPANSGQGASIAPPKTISPPPSPGVVSKLAEAGKRAGKSLSPVGKRFTQPFHWRSPSRDSQLAGEQTVQQPGNTIQVPESVQTIPAEKPESMPSMPTRIASRPDAKFKISDATPQISGDAPSVPGESPPAASLPITADSGEFHSIQQPNMDATDSVVASPTTDPPMAGKNSYSIRDNESTMLPSSTQSGLRSMLVQPTELVPAFEAPAEGPSRQKPAASPRANNRNKSIQQPEAVLSSSAPGRSANTGSHQPRQTAVVTGAPAQLRLPDMVLPAKPQEADEGPGQRPRSTQGVRISDRVAPEAKYRISDSVTRTAASTATRTLWQPDAVR